MLDPCVLLCSFFSLFHWVIFWLLGVQEKLPSVSLKFLRGAFLLSWTVLSLHAYRFILYLRSSYLLLFLYTVWRCGCLSFCIASRVTSDSEICQCWDRMHKHQERMQPEARCTEPCMKYFLDPFTCLLWNLIRPFTLHLTTLMYALLTLIKSSSADVGCTLCSYIALMELLQFMTSRCWDFPKGVFSHTIPFSPIISWSAIQRTWERVHWRELAMWSGFERLTLDSFMTLFVLYRSLHPIQARVREAAVRRLAELDEEQNSNMRTEVMLEISSLQSQSLIPLVCWPDVTMLECKNSRWNLISTS